jgi:hypothetical protein
MRADLSLKSSSESRKENGAEREILARVLEDFEKFLEARVRMEPTHEGVLALATDSAQYRTEILVPVRQNGPPVFLKTAKCHFC